MRNYKLTLISASSIYSQPLNVWAKLNPQSTAGARCILSFVPKRSLEYHSCNEWACQKLNYWIYHFFFEKICTIKQLRYNPLCCRRPHNLIYSLTAIPRQCCREFRQCRREGGAGGKLLQGHKVRTVQYNQKCFYSVSIEPSKENVTMYSKMSWLGSPLPVRGIIVEFCPRTSRRPWI